MADHLPEWPAEPWVVSGPGAPDPNEIGCIFQEGEVEPIAVVDKDRDNPDDYVQATAQRICACVNAMAGIDNPEGYRFAVDILLAQVADLQAENQRLRADKVAIDPEPNAGAAADVRLDDLEMSIRTSAGLRFQGIKYLGQLAQKTEAQVLRMPNFGNAVLAEIKGLLAGHGLRLGMELPDWKVPL